MAPIEMRAHIDDHHAVSKDRTDWGDIIDTVGRDGAPEAKQTHVVPGACLEHQHDILQDANIAKFQNLGSSPGVET